MIDRPLDQPSLAGHGLRHSLRDGGGLEAGVCRVLFTLLLGGLIRRSSVGFGLAGGLGLVALVISGSDGPGPHGPEPCWISASPWWPVDHAAYARNCASVGACVAWRGNGGSPWPGVPPVCALGACCVSASPWSVGASAPVL